MDPDERGAGNQATQLCLGRLQSDQKVYVEKMGEVIGAYESAIEEPAAYVKHMASLYVTFRFGDGMQTLADCLAASC